jgi:choline monooxygenase
VTHNAETPSNLVSMVDAYHADEPLERASTIPASWYVDRGLFDLELRSVFARSWQLAGRLDQLARRGQYVSYELPGGEPIIIVRGEDDEVRGFFNVCRHHAAAVVTEPQGAAAALRCPYHGWTYGLDGQLRGTPDLAGVCDFDRASNGLVPVDTASWQQWIFARIESGGPPLDDFLGADLTAGIRPLAVDNLMWMERRRYTVDCNWKVFVDNYLDGGYHVPHLHKGLDSVLDYSRYAIEIGDRFCLQSSPLVTAGAAGVDAQTAAVRTGGRAFYYWIYPNFMINWYDGAMDTNLVIPRTVDTTDVIFDFYFSDVSDQARARNLASIDVSERIQEEDVAICASVQRGLRSRAYTAGRLSVRREGGEHLFHRLLYADLKAALRRAL